MDAIQKKSHILGNTSLPPRPPHYVALVLNENAVNLRGGTLLKFMILVMVRNVDHLGFYKLILMCRIRI